ncbi:MAG: tyrosine-type recombinase/integrase [Candidatus Sumerlaeia bacterium]|nr:tyrosine-type recombinase/integrase [Candidatus Sumerlaeia bacterium]
MPTSTKTERNRYRLSDAVIAKLPPHDPDSPSREKEWADSEAVGLRLSVAKNGRKRWDVRIRLRGRKLAMRIGEWPAVSTTEARRRANEMKAKASLGVDPRAEREAARAMPTVSEFAKEYLSHARRTIRSARDSEQRLRDHVLPALGRKLLDEVRRGDVERLHAEWLDAMTPASANRVLATVKALFSHATRMELVGQSPAQGVRNHKENNARQRCLSGEELQRYLAAVAEEPNPVLRGYLRVLLATGMRRTEALTARWENVDLDNRTLLLPETKSGKSRVVVLNDAAIAALTEVQREHDNPYLFPGAKPGTHLAEPKFAHERACRKAGIDNLRMHDLRHTFASLAVSAGTSLYAVQGLLGHASPVMSQRYAHLSNEAARQGAKTVSDALLAAAPHPKPDDAAPASSAAKLDTQAGNAAKTTAA